tara:strand:- start:292 stop:1191 length:900 start_codon:yes stop_codon:yes gene_type:complete
MRAISLNNQVIKLKEPFKGLFTQGMVCHETYKDLKNNWLSPDEVFTNNGKEYFIKNNPLEKVKVGPSESMSKSKKNTIDPESIINKYGADPVRFFILADSPPEKDIQWSENGMLSAYKFIQKFWLLNNQISEIFNKDKCNKSEELEAFTNQTINKINLALEKFRYNVIIAIYHEIYTFFKKQIDKNKNYNNLKNCYQKILILLMPVIPHISNECLDGLNIKDDIKWPVLNKKYLIESESEIVIQINGKKRSNVKVKKECTEKELLQLVHELKLVEKYTKEKQIIKTIYVKNRLINYIIK